MRKKKFAISKLTSLLSRRKSRNPKVEFRPSVLVILYRNRCELRDQAAYKRLFLAVEEEEKGKK